jgi:hypothetical protein
MSSVSRADREHHTDEIRQIREENRNREAEAAKRSRAEKKRQQENHDQEVAQLKKNFAQQLDTIRNRHRETLTERDQQYQREIEKVRKMFSEQNRNLTKEKENLRKNLEQTYQAEINRERQTAAQQKDLLKKNFDQTIRDQSEQFANFQENSVQEMKQALDQKTNKLRDRFEKEQELGRLERESKVLALQKEKDEIKKSLGREIRDLRRINLSNQRISHDQMLAQARSKDEIHQRTVAERDQMLKQTIDSLREKNLKAIGEKAEEFDAVREQLKDTVHDRFQAQLRALKAELDRSKNDRTTDMVTNQRLRNLEKAALINEYENRLRELEDRKNQLKAVLVENNNQRIQESNRRNEKLLEENNRKNRLEKNMISQQAREGMSQLELEKERMVIHEKDVSEKRIRQIVKTTQDEQKANAEYFENQIEKLKSQYAENLAKQREWALENLAEVRLNAQKKLQEIESRAAKRQEELVMNYQDKIEQLERNFAQEKKMMAQQFEARLKQRDRAFADEKNSLIMKYEGRITKQQEERQKELDRINQRHQSEMKDLAARLKYLNKNA